MEYFKRSSPTYTYRWCWVKLSRPSKPSKLDGGSLLIEEDGTILATSSLNQPLPDMATTKWEI